MLEVVAYFIRLCFLATKRSRNFLSDKDLLVFFFFLINLWVCVLRSGFAFLLFLFKTHLDLNSYDFQFLIFFIYLKLINFFFFNLDADVAFFDVKKHFLLLIQATWTLIQHYLFLPFATSDFFISDVMAKTKTGSIFQDRD